MARQMRIAFALLLVGCAHGAPTAKDEPTMDASTDSIMDASADSIMNASDNSSVSLCA